MDHIQYVYIDMSKKTRIEYNIQKI